MNDYFEIAKLFVDTAKGSESMHFKRTVDWVKTLSQNPSEAMLIAAYSHDIERILRPSEISKKRRTFVTKEKLKIHQEHGGKIMEKVLINNGMPTNIAHEVYMLISKHEEGGTQEQNILMCADSLSYFETNANKHLKDVKNGECSIKSVKDKFDFMFNRINISDAQIFATPMYKKLLEELNK